MNLKSWISAFRLRTLPLALASITMGTIAAGVLSVVNWPVYLLALSTAICLQILSNLANDYGDFVKGTDNEKRIGNQRALQSGAVTKDKMKAAIAVFVMLSLASGVLLLLRASVDGVAATTWVFLAVGLLAIGAALKYTMGKHPYGYSGFGDIFVFIFFGPVAVVGTFMLHQAYAWNPANDWPVIPAAVSLGMFATAVLNTNNIRDMQNDEHSGKRTIPVRIGLRASRIYHSLLIGSGICGLAVFILVVWPVYMLGALAGTWPMLRQLKSVWMNDPSPVYNGLLKQLSISILLCVLLMLLFQAGYHFLTIAHIIL